MLTNADDDGITNYQNAIVNVVREFGLTPKECAEMYMDRVDEQGLLFWNDLVLEKDRQIRASQQ